MKLLLVDTTGIQAYVFGSNRLRENVGASYLVSQATGRWVLEAVQQAVATRHNVHDVERGVLDDRGIEDGLDIEVIYAGGGNTLMLVKDGHAGARSIVSALSRRLLTDAPGLDLAIGEADLDWDAPRGLMAAQDAAVRDLDRRKGSGRRSAPLLGLGVSAACRSTGLPAAGFTRGYRDEAGYPASATVLAKDGVRNQVDRALSAVLPVPNGYRYPLEFDMLGRTRGESSFLAVVHADGNGLGQRLRAIRHPDNRDQARALRAFSTGVHGTVEGALRHTLADLMALITDGSIPGPDPAGVVVGIQLARDSDTDSLALPFRPIVIAGDDVTFVCDGRIGLGLAVRYLEHFETESANHLPDRATACAGVAIVPAHFPFARAYELSLELTGSAKAYSTTPGSGTALPPSALDWHWAQGGLAGSLGDIREREYTTQGGGSLTLRPVTVGANQQRAERLRSWEAISRGARAFQGTHDAEPGWLRGRNKVKALRDALREGPDAVARFLDLFNGGADLPNLEVPSSPALRRTGWAAEYCGYFDAIELSESSIPVYGRTP